MKSRMQEVSVGFFVACAAAALFFLAMKVSGLISVFGSQNTYKVTAYFENIGGLAPRAKVSMSGVTVGKVSDISYDTEKYKAKVVLDIDEAYKKISSDSYASISTAGILGEQFISIEPGADETYLQEGDEFEQTQSAMNIEDLVRQFVMNKSGDSDNEDEAIKQTDNDLKDNVVDFEAYAKQLEALE